MRKLPLSRKHQDFLDHFTSVCQIDTRVFAAFIGGSYARGLADYYSDLDLTIIITDETFGSFLAERDVFVRSLGKPLFVEGFDLPNVVFTIFSDGTEAELHFVSHDNVNSIHSGPFHTLVDKTGILTDKVFLLSRADPSAQTEELRKLTYWFWHDMSHFITAIGRGQLWWAYGQLDALQRICLSLARMKHDFQDEDAGEEPYFKLENKVSQRALALLQSTYCPMNRELMLRSVNTVLAFYKETVQPLAQAHGIDYPAELQDMMTSRLSLLDLSPQK